MPPDPTPPRTPGGPSAIPRPQTESGWGDWSDQRREAMRPLTDENARIRSDMHALESGGDYGPAAEARYRGLENDLAINEVNQRTAFPPHISDSGNFEPGDLRGYLQSRAEETGGPGAFERMSPEQQRQYITDNAPGYEQERAQEAARRDGQRRLPGVSGEALGEVLAQTTTPPWMGPSNARAAASAGACATCGGGPGGAAPAREPGAIVAQQAPFGERRFAGAIYDQRHAPADARHEDGPLYRGDSRTPEQIRAAGGFQGQDPSNDTSLQTHMRVGRPASPWVSTTTDPDVAIGYATNPFPLRGQTGFSEEGYIYRVQQGGGVIVDGTTARQVPLPGAMMNREVAFSEAIPWQNVQSYARVTPGMSTPRWIQNPDYVPPGVR